MPVNWKITEVIAFQLAVIAVAVAVAFAFWNRLSAVVEIDALVVAAVVFVICIAFVSSMWEQRS